MRATVVTPTTMMPKHSIKMKNGYLMANADMAIPLPCCRSAPVNAPCLGFTDLARLIAAQIAHNDPLAFGESGQNFHVVRALDAHLHLARLHPVLRVQYQHRRLAAISPRWMASMGTVRALGRLLALSVTSAYMPGCR